MSCQLDAFLALYSRETRENVLCLRNVILEFFPTAKERIDSKSRLIAYSFAPKAEKNLVFAIMPHMKHVNLMFSKGSQTPDPEGLLIGTGKQVRHIKITSEADTQNPAFQQLLKEALKLNYRD